MPSENFLKNKLVNKSDKFSLKSHHKKFTDDDYQFRKTCLEMCLKHTQREASKRLAELGFVNQKGNAFSVVSVRKYALEFVILWPLDARRLYQTILGEYPNTPDGEASWIFFIITEALKHYHGKEYFLRWAVKHGVYKKGFRIFQPHFNLRDDDMYAFDYALGIEDGS